MFSPFVRQATFFLVSEWLAGKIDGGSIMASSIRDTKDAFSCYYAHWNSGRPYVLLGHSQGAEDLVALLADLPDGGKNLAAAYVPGLSAASGVPSIPMKFPSSDEPSTPGVVATWNTWCSDTEPSGPFACRDSHAVNPLTWTADSSAAPAELNKYAYFWDYRKPSAEAVRKPGFCGARLDAEKGALLVDLPSDSEWDAHGLLGRGALHMNGIWFFAGNILGNALLRTRAI